MVVDRGVSSVLTDDDPADVQLTNTVDTASNAIDVFCKRTYQGALNGILPHDFMMWDDCFGSEISPLTP